MLEAYGVHNLFRQDIEAFYRLDPHLQRLASLRYQYHATWWHQLSTDEPGVYILSGGRQVGKSTSCKQLIAHCLQENKRSCEAIFYLPCDEIYDAKELSRIIRHLINDKLEPNFLLIIDEITYVKDWDRVIKAIADEGLFMQGVCILTGSDTHILKDAAMRFPGRRGNASQTDFHLFPLSFYDYVKLKHADLVSLNTSDLKIYFSEYIQTGGYLRAINDFAEHDKILDATYATYEQWVRGDFLKRNKKESYLLEVLKALFTTGVSQTSYTKLTQRIGILNKDTCIDYINLLERMDVMFTLQAFDQNKKQGFPRKDRKFHFIDPFIQQSIYQWLKREAYINGELNESNMVEAIVASHCARAGKSYYFKGDGEVDVIALLNNQIKAVEVKWSEQLRANDLKTLKQFKLATILGKNPEAGHVDGVDVVPVYQFLYELGSLL